MFSKIRSRFLNFYIFIFTVFSVGYIYTLFKLKLSESFIFSVAQVLVQVYFLSTEASARSITLLGLVVSIYLSIWTNQLKENYY